MASPAPPAPAASLPDAPDRDLYQLTAELTPFAAEDVPRVVNPDPVAYAEGRHDTFWLIDLADLRRYTSSFELRLVTPHAYWYFEEGQSVRQADIEEAAAVFEQEIYPLVTSAFGGEWTPGVDNDPHLNILNARLPGLGGYFSGSDEYPRSVNQFSNEREVIYVNSESISVGTTAYSNVLAHELQHAAHWNADLSEDQWVNEGLSELAATIAGFDQGGGVLGFGSRPVSLVNWPLSTFPSGASYNAASLFFHYLWEHYGDAAGLRPLLNQPLDGIPGVTAYLAESGYDADFRDVFRDWAVANLLDEDQGPYGYAGLDVQTTVAKRITGFSEFDSQIPQYAVEYVELRSFEGPLRLRFRGPTESKLLPVEVGARGCWWGNSGDVINSTMTRRVDLTGLDRATLTYQVWFNLEEDWDYGYLEVSADGGQAWDILDTPNTTGENPIGNSFGMGYTGDTQGWLDEAIDLSEYAGRQILVRFQHITDETVSGSGICVREIAMPEARTPDLMDGWQSSGFLLTDNRVRQDYMVQVVEIGPKFNEEIGRGNRVRTITLDQANTGEITVAAPQELDRLVVAVAALAPKTREEAAYTLIVEPAEQGIILERGGLSAAGMAGSGFNELGNQQ